MPTSLRCQQLGGKKVKQETEQTMYFSLDTSSLLRPSRNTFFRRNVEEGVLILTLCDRQLCRM
jgi:hypothetical protein